MIEFMNKNSWINNVKCFSKINERNNIKVPLVNKIANSVGKIKSTNVSGAKSTKTKLSVIYKFVTINKGKNLGSKNFFKNFTNIREKTNRAIINNINGRTFFISRDNSTCFP